MDRASAAGERTNRMVEGQCRAEQSRAEQSRAEQSKTGQAGGRSRGWHRACAKLRPGMPDGLGSRQWAGRRAASCLPVLMQGVAISTVVDARMRYSR